MIISRIIGGLGNQMFQYAAGLALARREGTTLQLDVRDYATYSLQPYGLYRLNIEALKAKNDTLRHYPRWRRGLSERSAIVGRWLTPAPHWHMERSLRYSKEWECLGPNSYLSGYFQSEKYFSVIRPTLLEQFKPDAQPSESANKTYWLIERAGNSVALHVRRGDYASNPVTRVTHGLCSIDYYNRAVAVVNSLVDSPSYFVFSDDPAWAREHIQLPGAHYVLPETNAPERDIYLMSRCRHHIIANSSFSWWGAWLAESPNQVVMTPTPWFDNPALDAGDLIPSRWFSLQK